MLIFLGPQSACTLSANENSCGCLYQQLPGSRHLCPIWKMCSTSKRPPTPTILNWKCSAVCFIYTQEPLCPPYILCVLGNCLKPYWQTQCKWWFWEGGRDNRKAVTQGLTHRVASSLGPFVEKVRVTDGVDQQEIRDWSKSFWHSKGCRKASL